MTKKARDVLVIRKKMNNLILFVTCPLHIFPNASAFINPSFLDIYVK